MMGTLVVKGLREHWYERVKETQFLKNLMTTIIVKQDQLKRSLKRDLYKA